MQRNQPNTSPTPGLRIQPKKSLLEQKRKNDRANQQRRQVIREKIEIGVMRDLRKLFESNGARNIINLPCISPVPSERTIFLSKAIRL